ncbi:Scr1 family TA system antitoxin-like transcriptional regulator [Micromonospora sp. U21]|uniref:Scr1 family TA system antitoxin-like transcriptional regulator n=1 Tax=Micromonospora sp. U21 TaxID=2824899 RepID=UPI001FFCF499|nr:Scr1 family TA system antitoxin-like transcriptional regulator [Micromonospora sp. U21]
MVSASSWASSRPRPRTWNSSTAPWTPAASSVACPPSWSAWTGRSRGCVAGRRALSRPERVRWYEPRYVPGLFQTEAYARAVFEAGGLLDPEEVDRRLTDRMNRQDVQHGERAPQIVAVLNEAVLRRRWVGGRCCATTRCTWPASLPGTLGSGCTWCR